MTDCYRILGVSRHASPREIRAAYLARIKLCHPDAAQSDDAGDAREISHAYWQLRDAHRRAEHDHLLFAPRLPANRPKSRRRPVKVSLRKPPPRPGISAAAARRRTSRPPVNRRLQPLRAAAGVCACALAIAGFAAAGTHFGAHAPPQAHAAASLGVPSAADRPPPQARRRIDPDLAAAATREFRQVIAHSGPAGAHLYARQCLMELTVRASTALLDHCVSFDDAASAWENAAGGLPRTTRRYFAPDQRFGRYTNAARDIVAGPVRESMMAEARYFAVVGD